MNKRVLHVASNVAHYADPSEPTGLWLSELTHAWDILAERSFDQPIVNPKGGLFPLEPAPSDGRCFTETASQATFHFSAILRSPDICQESLAQRGLETQ